VVHCVPRNGGSQGRARRELLRPHALEGVLRRYRRRQPSLPRQRSPSEPQGLRLRRQLSMPAMSLSFSGSIPAVFVVRRRNVSDLLREGPHPLNSVP
jgi:hypothetical protein